MRETTTSIPSLLLSLLPLLVFVLLSQDLISSINTVIIMLVYLILVGLIWFGLMIYHRFVKPEIHSKDTTKPVYKINSITVSHYCEKIRFITDFLNLSYVEEFDIGIMGVFFTGRSVPCMTLLHNEHKLYISGSDNICHYLYCKHKNDYTNINDNDNEASSIFESFLNPTPEAVSFEKKLDTFGHFVQKWIYYPLFTVKNFQSQSMLLRAWGMYANKQIIPIWQRIVLIIMFPIFKIFIGKVLNVNEEYYKKSLDNFDQIFDEIEQRLFENYKKYYGTNKNKNKNKNKNENKNKEIENIKFEDVKDKLGKDSNLFLLSSNKLSYIDLTFASLGHGFGLDKSIIGLFARGRKDIYTQLVDLDIFEEY